MATLYIQSPTLYQASSGNIVGATSITLTSLTDIYGNVLTMSDFGALGYFTCEPDTTNSEGGTFTGVTANANGTYTLTGVKTILAKSPYTQTSGLVRQHSGGTKVVVTDNVGFWDTFVNKNNDSTVLGKITLTSTQKMIYDASPTITDDKEVATKKYVDDVAIAGSPDASTTVKGISEEATQAEVLAKTATGGTGARLFVNPSTLASTLLSDYKADTGSANAYVITPAPAITAYTVGQVFSFKATNANTTTSTLNVNGLGVKTINKAGGATALASGDIAAGMIVQVEYDGTNFVMLNPVATPPITAITDTGFLTSGAPGTTTTNTSATVLTYALAGGILGTNKGVRIRMSVQVAITANNNTATYTIAYGGTTIGTLGYSGNSGNPTVTAQVVAEIMLFGAGTTSSQRSNLTGTFTTISGSGGAQTSQSQQTGSAAIDSTASQNITIACTAGASVTGTLIDYFIQKVI